VRRVSTITPVVNISILQFFRAYIRYLTIIRIEDPNYINRLAVCPREVEREDGIGLLDGMPGERALDVAALRVVVRGAD
jgi:hypothetical protein